MKSNHLVQRAIRTRWAHPAGQTSPATLAGREHTAASANPESPAKPAWPATPMGLSNPAGLTGPAHPAHPAYPAHPGRPRQPRSVPSPRGIRMMTLLAALAALLWMGPLAAGLQAQTSAVPATTTASPAPVPGPSAAPASQVAPALPASGTTLADTVSSGSTLPSLDRLGLGDHYKVLINKALESSQDYRSALLAMEKAGQAVEPILLLETASLSTSLSAASASTTSTSQDPALSLTTSLALPILDQLAVSASLNDQLESNFGLTVSPLKHSARFETSRIAWEKTVLQAETARKSAISRVISRILDWQSARKTLQIRQAQVEVKSALYESAKAGYAVDAKTVTLDVVRDALKNLNTARTALASAQKTLAVARLSLQESLGQNPQTTEIPEPGIEELRDLVRQDRVELPDTAYLTWNPTVGLARLEAESARANLDNTWAWEPDLQIKGGIKVPQDLQISWSASVVLTLSPTQVQPEARTLAEKSWQLALDSLSGTEAQAANTWTQDRAALQSARDMVDSLELSLAQARELAEETRLLAKAGEKTDLEVREADLDLQEAETALWSGLAEEFKAWLALLELLP